MVLVWRRPGDGGFLLIEVQATPGRWFTEFTLDPSGDLLNLPAALRVPVRLVQTADGKVAQHDLGPVTVADPAFADVHITDGGRPADPNASPSLTPTPDETSPQVPQEALDNEQNDSAPMFPADFPATAVQGLGIPAAAVVVESPADGRSLLYAVMVAEPGRVQQLGGFTDEQRRWLESLTEAQTAPQTIPPLLREAVASDTANALAAHLAKLLRGDPYRDVLDRLIITARGSEATAAGSPRAMPAERERQRVRADIRNWRWDGRYGAGFAAMLAEVLGRPLAIARPLPDSGYELHRVGPHRYVGEPIVLRETRAGHYDAILTGDRPTQAGPTRPHAESAHADSDAAAGVVDPSTDGRSAPGTNAGSVHSRPPLSRLDRFNRLRRRWLRWLHRRFWRGRRQAEPRRVFEVRNVDGQPVRPRPVATTVHAHRRRPSAPRWRWETVRRIVLPHPAVRVGPTAATGRREGVPSAAIRDAGEIVQQHLRRPWTAEQVPRALDAIRRVAEVLHSDGDEDAAHALARDLLGRNGPVPGPSPDGAGRWRVRVRPAPGPAASAVDASDDVPLPTASAVDAPHDVLLPTDGWRLLPEGYAHAGQQVLITTAGHLVPLPDIRTAAASSSGPARVTLALVDPTGLYFESADRAGLRYVPPLVAEPSVSTAPLTPAPVATIAAALPDGMRLVAVAAGLLLAATPELADVVAAVAQPAIEGHRLLFVDPARMPVDVIRSVARRLPGSYVLRVTAAGRITPDQLADLRRPFPDATTTPGLRVLASVRALQELPTVAGGFVTVPSGGPQAVAAALAQTMAASDGPLSQSWSGAATLPELAADIVFTPTVPALPSEAASSLSDTEPAQTIPTAAPIRRPLAAGWVTEQTRDGLWIRPDADAAGGPQPDPAARGDAVRITVGLPGTSYTVVPPDAHAAIMAIVDGVPDGQPLDLVLHGIPRWQFWTTGVEPALLQVDPGRSRIVRQLTPVPGGLAVHLTTAVPDSARGPVADQPIRITPDRHSVDPRWLAAALEHLHPRARAEVVLDLRQSPRGVTEAVLADLASLVDGRVLLPPVPGRPTDVQQADPTDVRPDDTGHAPRVDAELRADPEPRADAELRADPEPRADAELMADARTDVDSEARTADTDLDAQPDVQVGAGPEPTLAVPGPARAPTDFNEWQSAVRRAIAEGDSEDLHGLRTVDSTRLEAAKQALEALQAVQANKEHVQRLFTEMLRRNGLAPFPLTDTQRAAGIKLIQDDIRALERLRTRGGSLDEAGRRALEHSRMPLVLDPVQPLFPSQHASALRVAAETVDPYPLLAAHQRAVDAAVRQTAGGSGQEATSAQAVRRALGRLRNRLEQQWTLDGLQRSFDAVLANHGLTSFPLTPEQHQASRETLRTAIAELGFVERGVAGLPDGPAGPVLDARQRAFVDLSHHLVVLDPGFTITPEQHAHVLNARDAHRAESGAVDVPRQQGPERSRTPDLPVVVEPDASDGPRDAGPDRSGVDRPDDAEPARLETDQRGPESTGQVLAPDLAAEHRRMGAASLRVRGLGIPQTGLPGVDQLIVVLRQALDERGVTVSPVEWQMLPQQLLSTYRYLVSDSRVIRLGDAEVLVALEISDPRIEFDPNAEAGNDAAAGFAGIESVNAIFQTGAHARGQTGQGSAFRAGVSGSIGLGLVPGIVQALKVGAGLNLRANVITRGTGHIEDAEGGHVLDVRDKLTYVSYAGRLTALVRTKAQFRLPWAAAVLRDSQVTVTPGERISVALPSQYLQQPPGQLVRAVGPVDSSVSTGLRSEDIPATFYAAQLQRLHTLVDAILSSLRQRRLDLDTGHSARAELVQKVYHLDAHLDVAFQGYEFFLHDQGRKIARVVIKASRHPDGDQRLGRTTSTAHIERVRTAIVGESNSESAENGLTATVFGEASLLPTPGLALGPRVEASYTWTDSDSLASGRGNLWVQVSRETGMTSAHELPLTLSATVDVLPRELAPRILFDLPYPPPSATDTVDSSVVLVVPEADAFDHGLQVDLEGLRPEVRALVEESAVPHRPDAVRFAGPEQQPARQRLPRHLQEGRGLGQSLVRVDQGTDRVLREELATELRRTGFLPSDETQLFKNQRTQRNSRLDRQLDNRDMLHKMVSVEALESFFSVIVGVGLTFTMTNIDARGRTSHARITIRGEQILSDSPEYWQRRTDGQTIVTLSMGMGNHSQGVGGRQTLQVGAALVARLKALPWVTGLQAGAKHSWSFGATDSLGLLTNKPNLMEYPGSVDEYRLPVRLWTTVEYSKSALPRYESPKSDHQITAHVLPYFEPPAPTDPAAVRQETPTQVFSQAVVSYLDVSGLLEAAREMLPELTGPGAATDQEVTNFLSPIAIMSNIPAILSGRYTRQLFRAGLIRQKIAMISVHAVVHESTHGGATPDKFVHGKIDLAILTGGQSAETGKGRAVEVGKVGVGGTTTLTGLNKVSFSGSATAKSGTSTNVSRSHTSGREYLNLDFNQADGYFATVTLVVSVSYEQAAKLAPDTVRRPTPRLLAGKQMMYLLPTPTALARYAAGELPMPQARLGQVLADWSSRDLELPGSVVAGVLARWEREDLAGPAVGYSPERQRWAGELADRLGVDERLSIEPTTRRRFEESFGLRLPDLPDPYAHLRVPQYLLRSGPKALGHAGLQHIAYSGGRSLIDVVHEAIEVAHPGALAQQVSLWSEHTGSVSGRLQGGLEMLEATFGGDREWALLEELLHRDGLSFFVHVPKLGLLSDVLEIRVRMVLTSQPRVREFLANTGNENYGHAYSQSSVGVSKSAGWSVGAAGLGLEGTQGITGGPSLTLAEGQSRSTTRSEVNTREQTVYDFNGNYVLTTDGEFEVTVTHRLSAGRPMANTAVRAAAWLAGQDETVRRTVTARLELRLPKGLMEAAAPTERPLEIDLRPLPPLPGDATVLAVTMDDALPVARNLVMRLSDEEGAAGLRPALSLVATLGRGGLVNHLPAALGPEGLLIGDGVHQPGHSTTRSALRLHGQLFDAHVVGLVEGAGTGRYAKQQSGVTSTVTTDPWAAVIAGSIDNSQVLGVKDPDHLSEPFGKDLWTAATAADRLAARHEQSSGTSNARAEGHLKQLGPSVLVRLQGRFHFAAERSEHHMFTAPTPAGEFRSQAFAGEIFVQMSADRFSAMMESHNRSPEARPDLPQPTAAPAGAIDQAQAVDLDAIVSEIAWADPDPSFALIEVARVVGAQTSAGRSIRLSTDPASRARQGDHAVVEWARTALRHGATSRPDARPAVDQARVQIEQWYADPTADSEGDLSARARIERVRELVLATLDGGDGPLAGTPAFPQLALASNQTWLDLARLIAFRCDTRVWLRERTPDGGETVTEIDNHGRVVGPYAFDRVVSTWPALRRWLRATAVAAARGRYGRLPVLTEAEPADG
ncbi:hypothetical protein [Micromonospora sp. NPDC049274]|uniref:hypothetical protein n=1 Tax=Micromonospora sp. NPDC049274 TaxID=3154829 RepID=UPI0034292261